jgi:hypothetical protein
MQTIVRPLTIGSTSYRFGIANWVTQGLPYYIFAAVKHYRFVKDYFELRALSSQPLPASGPESSSICSSFHASEDIKN